MTYSYAAGTGVITLTGMPSSLASGSSVGPITLSYIQPGSATSTVTASISATTADPNPNNNSVTVTIAGTAEADAATTASFPASVNAGQTVSGTVTYTNNGPSTAVGTTFSLTVPANLAVAPTLSGLPNGVTYSYTAATGVVTLTGMPTSLASGSSVGPITLSYIQPGSATSTVTAGIAATTADPNPNNNSVTVTIAGTAEADAATTASFPASVNAGQTVSGTVTFTNKGPSTAAGTTFSLTVPANLAVAPILSGLPNGVTYSYTAATGVITLAGMPSSLASGSTVGPITLSYTQPGSGTSTVTAAIAATTNDPNPNNNSVTLTIGGNPSADAATTASFPASVNAGQTISGTVTFTNNGPSTAVGTTFSLTVPANLTVAPILSGLPNGVAYSYTAATGVVTLTGMPTSMASGSSLGPIGISYTQPASGTSTVTASISATTADPNPNNNSVTVTIAGNAEADAVTSASFPASVNAGQTVSGTVTFTNNGPSTAVGTIYSLAVPANLAVAPTLSGLPNGVTYSYTAASGVITLTGMPTSLTSGSSVGPIGISYLQPPAGTSTVTATISATTADPNPNNNSVTVTIAGNAEADAATSASFPASVNAGQTVSGTVTFTNNGPSTATGTTFSLTVPANLTAAPTLTGLPAGVTYSYNAATGVITLTGMPTSLASGSSLGPISISYTQPAAGNSTVTAAISATTADPNPNNNSVTVTIAGNAEADAATTATFPASVNAGQTVSGIVTFTNHGPSTAVGTAFSLTVPANLAMAPILSGLPNGVTYSYTVATGVITLTGMPTSMASGSSLGPISISYTQPATGSSTVTAAISATTADPNPNNNSVTVTIAGNAEADAATSASFPASINAGQTVTGTVTFTNNGPSAAVGTTFSLIVPANLAVAPTLSGLPNGVTYTYVAATGVITLTGMPTSLASGSSLGPISISYTQPASGSSTVTAAISATTADPNPNNNSVTVTIAGNAEADAATSASFPASVNAGQTVSGTVRYTNNGPSTATGTIFSLTVPANLAVAPTLTGLPNGVTYSYTAATGVITLTGMPTSMASGSSLGPISISYTQPPTGTSTVTASISATTADPNPNNNSVTVTIAGNAEADAATSASFPASVNAGQTVSGTVTFTNNGPSTATGTTYSLTVPANLAAAPTLSGLPAGVTYSYTAATGVITLTGMPASLASGISVGPIGISFTQPASGTSTVTASISATTADPNPNNNSVTVTIAGNAEADAAVTASFPANVNAGQTVSGTVTFTNNGPSTTVGTTFSLTVPVNLAVAPTLTGLPAGVTYSYNAATGVITLTGMPTSMASGSSLGPITLSYIQPGSGTSTVTAAIAATTNDPNPNNNSLTLTIGGNSSADAAASGSFPASVNAGQTVSGTVTFTNYGPSTATRTTFSLTVSANLAVAPTNNGSSIAAGTTYSLTTTAGLAVAPTLSGLPAGVTYSYNAATGVITLTGMPTSMASGSSLGPIGISYTQPPSGTSTVTAAISATTPDPNLNNNSVTITIAGSAVELSGTVYVDNNQDQLFDSGDTPIVGATVQLLLAGHQVASTQTNSAGSYSFTGESAGNYSVVVTPSSGYVSDTPASVTVALSPGAPSVVNFGEIPASAVGALVLTKTTALVNISAGQSVPYTITATNSLNTPVTNVTVTDLMPAGFRFRAGSGSVDGQKLDPTVNGRQLSWTHLNFVAGQKKTFTLVLTAGAGVAGGDYVNQATAYNGLANIPISNLATATVRIVGDPTFDCPDLIGKVFDDANANGVEDDGEAGIAGVRLVTAQGLLVTTDSHGRYHIACPIMPDSELGTNFVVKLDERTLPSGYRLTTENPQTVRLTAGKVSKLNFGATIHHVVRIEVNDRAFAGNDPTAETRRRLDELVASLKDQSAVLRLAYSAAAESDAQVAQRLAALKASIASLWKSNGCQYPLQTEEDIVRSAGTGAAAGGDAP